MVGGSVIVGQKSIHINIWLNIYLAEILLKFIKLKFTTPSNRHIVLLCEFALMKLPENVNWHLANAYVVMKMPKSLINIIGVWQRVRARGVVIFYRAAKSIIPSMFTFRSENNCFRSYSLKCCHRKARNIWPSVSVSVFAPLSLNITYQYQYQTSEN